MPYTLTTPRPSHGSLNWDTNLETDLAGIAAAINGGGWVVSSVTSTGITAVSNWTLGVNKFRILNGVVALTLVVTRANSAMAAATATGIVTSGVQVAQLPSGLIPSQTNGALMSVGSSATVAGACQVTNSGAVLLTNVPPSYAVPIGGVLDLMGTYVL